MEQVTTKENLREAIREVLNDTNDEGETIIAEAMQREAKSIVGTLTLRFGLAFVGLVLTGAGTWYTLFYKVEAHETKIQSFENGVSQDQQKAYAEEVDRRFEEQQDQMLQLRSDMNENMSVIRQDIRDIRNAIVN